MNPQVATMFGLALLSVSMWTFRIAITARGMKLASAVLAAVEAVVYVLSFSRLVTDLGSPALLAGYGAGVGVGTAIGLVLDERTARGYSELQLIAQGDRADLVERFRHGGWPATSAVASGPEGPVTMMWLTVADSEVRQVSDLVRQHAPQAFWNLRRLREVTLSASSPRGADPTNAVVPARSRRFRPARVRPRWPARPPRRGHRPESEPALL